MLSIAATEPAGFGVLDYNFNVWAEEAALNGHTADRDKWRLMGPMHIAETVEQAKANCRYGLQWVFDYLSHIIPIGDPNDPPPPSDYDEFVDWANESGRMVIGTPEMAVAQIERLVDKTGGFGAFLFLGADLAELVARRSAATSCSPRRSCRTSPGQLAPVQTSYDKVIGAGTRWVDATLGAQLTRSPPTRRSAPARRVDAGRGLVRRRLPVVLHRQAAVRDGAATAARRRVVRRPRSR